MKTLLLSLLLALPAHGQLIISFSGGDVLSTGPGVSGFEFTEGAIPQTLRSLGVWDESGTGLTESHQVGLWDAETHALLVSAVVTPTGSTLVNGFWYTSLAAPITLEIGHSYVLGAQYSDLSFDLLRGNVPTVTTSGITLGSPVLSSGVTFSFPDVPLAQASAGFFGPDAGFVAVPEPSGCGVALAGLLLG